MQRRHIRRLHERQLGHPVQPPLPILRSIRRHEYIHGAHPFDMSSHHFRTDRLKPALKCLRQTAPQRCATAHHCDLLIVLSDQPNHVLARNMVRLEVISTIRTFARPLTGSTICLKGIGVNRPFWIDTMAALPPSRRNCAAQYPRSRVYSISNGIGSAQRNSYPTFLATIVVVSPNAPSPC